MCQIMRNFISPFLSLLFLYSCQSFSPQNSETKLPTEFSHDRFYVTPITPSGDTLRFFTDTGGGANMMYESTVERLHLETAWLSLGEDSLLATTLPPFQSEAAIPSPAPLKPFGNQLMVKRAPQNFNSDSGFLGRLWFANRIWEFNYQQGILSYHDHIDWSRRSTQHSVDLGFQVDSAGVPTTYFPRITITVNEDSLDLLFDTGATAYVDDNTAQKLGFPGADAVGTSFISESIFKKWREKHPEWRIINNADLTMNASMIEVPEITIAGHTVGPVWFTVRPDKNFSEFMSKWMDKQVVGAIGGSAFKYFNIIVDYPNQRADFEKIN